MKVQVQRLDDAWMVRWLDAAPDRPPRTVASPAHLCAVCCNTRTTHWTSRDVAILPTPRMWARCGDCEAVTWYALVPATLLGALSKKPPAHG
jgi:hypothetical protein